MSLGAGPEGESMSMSTPLTPSVSAADVIHPLSSNYHVSTSLNIIPSEHTQHAHTAEILHAHIRRSTRIDDLRPRGARDPAPNRARAAVCAPLPPACAHRPRCGAHDAQSQAPPRKWIRNQTRGERQTAWRNVDVMGRNGGRGRGRERGEYRDRADGQCSLSCSCWNEWHWCGAERQRQSRRAVIAAPSS